MLIGLGLALQARRLAAGGVLPSSGNKITIAAFSRDRTLFDSGMHLGLDSAPVPLQGTTDAGNGAAIQARAVSTDDGGATTTAWRDIATAAGDGSWSGVLDTPRSASWYRPEVRLKADPVAQAQGGNRFGAGVIVWIEDQSLFMYHLLPSLSSPASFVAVPDPEAVQLILAENRGAPTEADAGTVAPVRFLGDAAQGLTWYTSSMSQMARTIALNAPGLKVLLVCDVKEGTSAAQALFDGTGPDVRSFAVSSAIADLVHADGATVGIIHHTHDKGIGDIQDVPTFLNNWLPITYFGRDQNGNDIPVRPSPAAPIDIVVNEFGAVNQVHHLWVDIFPEFADYALLVDSQNGRSWRNGYQSLLFPSGTGKATDLADPNTWSSLLNIGDKEFWQYIRRRDQIAANPFLASKVVEGAIHNIMHGGAAQDVHHDINDPYNGVPEAARSRMALWMQGAGIFSKPIPIVDNVFWAPDGAYVDIWSSAGPITTKQKLHGLPPLDGTSPYHTEVMGLQYNGPNGQEFVHRAEIVDSTGAPASEGRIRIYPQAGDIFTGATRLYYFAADGFAGTSTADAFANKMNRFRPIVRQGWQHFDGFMLNPGQDVEVINNANPLSLPAGTQAITQIDGSTPGPVNTLGLGTGKSRLTIEASVVRTSAGTAGASLLRGAVSDRFYYNIILDDLSDKISVTIKNNSGSDFVGTLKLPPGALAASGGTLPTIRLIADVGAQARYVRLFVREAASGVENEWLSSSAGTTATGNKFGVAAGAAGTGFQGAGGDLRADVGLRLFQASVYDVHAIRVWLLAQPDGSAPLVPAWAEAVSNGAGDFIYTGTGWV